MTDTSNPLSQYFRLPGLEIDLPTKGAFMPAGTLEMNHLGKVEVFAMQGADELLLTSADALMSGVAIEKLIESCVPAIKKPELVSAPDLDVILIAIKAASSGNVMETEVECPKCNHMFSVECNLQDFLATVKEIPTNLDLRLSDEMVVAFRPHSIRDQTKLMLAAYNENRRIALLDNEDLPDDTRRQVLADTVDKLREFQNMSLASAIVSITVPSSEVTDRSFILEFVKNAPAPQKELIKKQVEDINSMGLDRNVPVICSSEKCKHEFNTTLEFNPASFFVLSSSD